MLLHDHMSSTGARLFRWRSYLLLAFVPFMILAMVQGDRIEAAFGPAAALAYDALCIALVAGGELIRILTVAFVPRGTSGRNTTGQLATGLNTTGAYSLLRNPLYLGNCLMYVGVALFTQSVVLALVLALVLLPYYERIIAAEESFLVQSFGQPYRDWAATTPAFIPSFRSWVKPALRFSLKTVIRREQASIFGAVLALYLVKLGLHLLGGAALPQGWHWALVLAAGFEVVAYLAKTRTAWLDVAGR